MAFDRQLIVMDTVTEHKLRVKSHASDLPQATQSTVLTSFLYVF